MFIFLILSLVFCSNKHSIKENSVFIITDREIKELIPKDSKQLELFKFEEIEKNLGSNFIWDIHFPKPLIYRLKFVDQMNSKSPFSLDLKGITSKDKVLFRLVLTYDDNYVVLSDVQITNSQSHIVNYSDNVFILSREMKNLENLKASFLYIVSIFNINRFYNEILINFFRYIKNIDYIVKSLRQNDDEKTFKQALMAKNAIISISIDIMQNAGALMIPSYYKFYKLPTVGTLKTKLNNVFISLENVVEVFLREKNKEIEKTIVLNEKDIIDYIKNEIIQYDSLRKCIQVYEGYIVELEIIEKFIDVVFHSNNTDFEIISDCNVEKLDEFADKYFYSMRTYCEIISRTDDQNVFNYCFDREKSFISSSVKQLYYFFSDKLIANRLLHFMNSYEENNKDFLVFTQTNYFKNTLSNRIHENLKLLEEVYSSLNNELETEDKLHKNLDLLNCIKNHKKDWESILKDDETLEIKSFESLLKQDQLPLPYTCDETFYKPVFFEENKQEDESKMYQKVI